MSDEFVFIRSIVLTVIIGVFLLVTGRAARKRACILAQTWRSPRLRLAIRSSRCRTILSFSPIAVSLGAVLTLSSHRHGGQLRFFRRPVIVAYDYMHGIYREGAASLDVTSGLGHWIPLRIDVPREISIITLRRA